jgi:hypothetical protein
MTPGSWTALFFLDEATALAAGHRPCGYCRRPDYLWFAESWRAAQGLLSRPLAVEMDARLHAERVDRARRQLTRQVTVADLPDGAMVRHQGVVALVQGAALLPWSITGYGESQQVRAGAQAELLTPPVIVGALAAGYRPLVHHSAAPASRPSVVAGEPAAKLRYFAPPDWRTGADPYG